MLRPDQNEKQKNNNKKFKPYFLLHVNTNLNVPLYLQAGIIIYY